MNKETRTHIIASNTIIKTTHSCVTVLYTIHRTLTCYRVICRQDLTLRVFISWVVSSQNTALYRRDMNTFNKLDGLSRLLSKAVGPNFVLILSAWTAGYFLSMSIAFIRTAWFDAVFIERGYLRQTVLSAPVRVPAPKVVTDKRVLYVPQKPYMI